MVPPGPPGSGTAPPAGAAPALPSADADSRFYTPVADDVGSYLRVVATYDDGHGPGKTVAAVTANRVLAVNPDNVRPVFDPNGDYIRSIREDQTPPRNLGSPITATDANSADRLTYSIPASDYFEIVDSSGQLRTKAVLDHEVEDEHTITVTATDPGNLRATVDVTITVEDVDETPEISGPNNPGGRRERQHNVATYSGPLTRTTRASTGSSPAPIAMLSPSPKRHPHLQRRARL